MFIEKIKKNNGYILLFIKLCEIKNKVRSGGGGELVLEVRVKVVVRVNWGRFLECWVGNY